MNPSRLLVVIKVGSDIFFEAFPLSIEVSVLIECSRATDSSRDVPLTGDSQSELIGWEVSGDTNFMP